MCGRGTHTQALQSVGACVPATTRREQEGRMAGTSRRACAGRQSAVSEQMERWDGARESSALERLSGAEDSGLSASIIEVAAAESAALFRERSCT